MLNAAHRDAGLMHLDVRLGNLVVTERGVGLIDFGSSVMVGEDLASNRHVAKVICRTLEASEITETLKRHRLKQLLGNPVFEGLPYPPSPAMDLFALATCMTRLRRRVLSRAPGEPGAISDMDGLARALENVAAGA